MPRVVGTTGDPRTPGVDARGQPRVRYTKTNQAVDGVTSPYRDRHQPVGHDLHLRSAGIRLCAGSPSDCAPDRHRPKHPPPQPAGLEGSPAAHFPTIDRPRRSTPPASATATMTRLGTWRDLVRPGGQSSPYGVKPVHSRRSPHITRGRAARKLAHSDGPVRALRRRIKPSVKDLFVDCAAGGGCGYRRREDRNTTK